MKNEARRREQRVAENFSAIEIAPKISQITGLYCSKIRTFTLGPGARWAVYRGSQTCTQSQLIPTKRWVQQCPTSTPPFRNGLHPGQGRKFVHAIHDNYYLTKVWVFKISKRVFLLQTLWLLTAQGTFFCPEREGLNLSLVILHSHLGVIFDTSLALGQHCVNM